MSPERVRDTALRRGSARVSGVLWVLAGASVAVGRVAHDSSRDIGHGVMASCHPPWASQGPQLAIAVAGGLLLIVAANRRAVAPRVVLGAATLLVAWVLVLIALPGAFHPSCAN